MPWAVVITWPRVGAWWSSPPSPVRSWEQRTLALRDQASGHADALAQTMYDFLLTDQDSVQATQQLLLWEDRGTTPVQAVGP